MRIYYTHLLSLSFVLAIIALFIFPINLAALTAVSYFQIAVTVTLSVLWMSSITSSNQHKTYGVSRKQYRQNTQTPIFWTAVFLSGAIGIVFYAIF
ncbi:MAG: hypothetical protein AAF902_07515 [Chloroflexota bacterium]